jgi:hypothetical protein
LRPRAALEAAGAKLPERLRPAEAANLDQEGRSEEDSVPDHGEEQLFDVLRRDVVTVVQERPGACRLLEREAAANRGADSNGVELARGADEIDDPPLEQLVDVDGLDRVLQSRDLLQRDRRLDVLERMAAPLLADDSDLFLGVGVAERGLQEEAVELSLREREGALQLDRVLRRQDEEGLRQDACDAVDGDLPLGHSLEERRLRLRHRAVDLVDEHHVGEDRALPELEIAALLVVDREAGDVGGLEVRGALDA